MGHFLLGKWSWFVLESKQSKPWKADWQVSFLCGLWYSPCSYIPIVTSLSAGPGNVRQNQPVPPQLGFGQGLLRQQRKLGNRTRLPTLINFIQIVLKVVTSARKR